MSRRIESIEGIGPSYSSRLADAGCHTVGKFLELGATKRGREQLAETTGLGETLLLKWINMADLFRVNGVGSEYAELLEAAGVDTVKELRNRNADNLASRMAAVNREKKLCRAVPGAKTVERWVAHAKTLPPMVEY